MCWSHFAWGFNSSHFRIVNHFTVSHVESATKRVLLKLLTSGTLSSTSSMSVLRRSFDVAAGMLG